VDAGQRRQFHGQQRGVAQRGRGDADADPDPRRGGQRQGGHADRRGPAEVLHHPQVVHAPLVEFAGEAGQFLGRAVVVEHEADTDHGWDTSSPSAAAKTS
jgi:hypothetical protein